MDLQSGEDDEPGKPIPGPRFPFQGQHDGESPVRRSNECKVNLDQVSTCEVIMGNERKGLTDVVRWPCGLEEQKGGPCGG